MKIPFVKTDDGVKCTYCNRELNTVIFKAKDVIQLHSLAHMRGVIGQVEDDKTRRELNMWLNYILTGE